MQIGMRSVTTSRLRGRLANVRRKGDTEGAISSKPVSDQQCRSSITDLSTTCAANRDTTIACSVIQPEAVVLGVPRIVGHEQHQPDQGGGIGECANREFDGRDSPAAADMASLDDLPR